jgi:UDPglucose 6-dehydrogenase
LFPGIGYGGSCCPKDVQALAKSSSEVGYRFNLLESVMNVNEKQKTALLPKIKSYFGNDLKNRTFALWGLAFKPDTDDIREAPALYIVDALLKEGANVVAYDPEAMPNVQKQLGTTIEYAKDPYQACAGADALIIATEWGQFRTPDFALMGQNLKQKVVFDGRNLFDVEQMRQLGYHYASIGRTLVSG